MYIFILITCLFVCSTQGHPSHHRPKRDEDVAGVTYSACKDTYSQCPEWKKTGMCEMAQYKDYMPLVCTETCGFCKGVYKARSEITSPTIIDATEHGEGDKFNVEAAVEDAEDHTRSYIYTPEASLKSKGDNPDDNTEPDDDSDADADGDEDLPGDEKSKIAESDEDGDDDDDDEDQKATKSNKGNEKLTSKSKIDDEESNKGEKKTEQIKHDDLMSTNGDTAALISQKASRRNAASKSSIKKDKPSTKTIITHKSKTSDKETGEQDVARAYTADDNPEPTVIDTSGDEMEDEGSAYNPDTKNTVSSADTTSEDAAEEASGEEKEDDDYEEAEPKQDTAARNVAASAVAAPQIPRAETSVTPVAQPAQIVAAPAPAPAPVQRMTQVAPATQPKLNDFPEEAGFSDDEVDDDEEEEDEDSKDEVKATGKVIKLKVAPLLKTKGKKKKANKAIKDGKITMLLEQNYDAVYQKKDSARYQLLSGNIKKDIQKMIKGTAVTDLAFSEATIEGNPRRVGKTKVSFNIDSDSTDWMESLLKLVDGGDIDGLRVIKGSLEIEETEDSG